MPIASPLPSSLPKECAKAAQIFNSFASIIPQDILRQAKGFAILTVAKAGFLFSARAGSGLVIVKLSDGSWSAPSAVGTGGVGVGGQAGAELSEFVIILNSRAAVQSFMSAGTVNLGGNLSVAVGPVGRNAEASGSLNKLATMYSYSKTRGLFGGASLEGSVIFERGDANQKAYSGNYEGYSAQQDDDSDAFDQEEAEREYQSYRNDPSSFSSSSRKGGISAKMILSGQVRRPPWANVLISSIERKVGSALDATWIDDAPRYNDEDAGNDGRRNRGYSFGSEFAQQSSASNSPAKDFKTRAKDRLSISIGGSNSASREDVRDWEAGGSIPKQPSGRLRGYSLGSFARGKGARGSGAGSGSGTNTPSFRGKARSNTYSDPDYQYRETEEEYNSRVLNAYDEEMPPSPSSTMSSRSTKFAEFMKRPVLPSRKSTGSFNSGSPSDMRGGGSPLAFSRNKSETFASRKKSNSTSKSKLEYSGRYDSSTEDDDFRHRTTFGGRRNDVDTSASPFADPERQSSFTSVEHQFDENNYGRNDSYNRRYSPTSTKKKSMLSTAAGVLSRPLTKRSATAPIPRRRNTNTNRAYDPYEDEERRDRLRRDREEDDYFGNATGAGASSGIKLYPDEYSEDEDHTQRYSEDSRDHNNPFADGQSHQSHDTFGTRDLLSTLTEDEDASLKSRGHHPVAPSHRLDIKYDKFDHGDHEDSRSIRSIDSENEFIFGNKAHRLDKVIKLERNDLSGSKKEFRMATYDFDGGESGDLSFKTGDVIEILSKADPDWWQGRIGSQEGIVPVNRTRPYNPESA